MAATPIAKAERFFAPEVSEFAICLPLADYTNPTRAEIDAGTAVLPEVSAVNGFQITGNKIDSPDYGSRFTPQSAGRRQVGDSSLMFYQDKSGANDVRSWIHEGDVFDVIAMWGGDVPGQLMDVFPVEVVSVGLSIPDNADADILVDFAVTAKPATNLAIPA